MPHPHLRPCPVTTTSISQFEGWQNSSRCCLSTWLAVWPATGVSKGSWATAYIEMTSRIARLIRQPPPTTRAISDTPSAPPLRTAQDAAVVAADHGPARDPGVQGLPQPAPPSCPPQSLPLHSGPPRCLPKCHLPTVTVPCSLPPLSSAERERPPRPFHLRLLRLYTFFKAAPRTPSFSISQYCSRISRTSATPPPASSSALYPGATSSDPRKCIHRMGVFVEHLLCAKYRAGCYPVWSLYHIMLLLLLLLL